jgi:hypothetical protein
MTFRPAQPVQMQDSLQEIPSWLLKNCPYGILDPSATDTRHNSEASDLQAQVRMLMALARCANIFGGCALAPGADAPLNHRSGNQE